MREGGGPQEERGASWGNQKWGKGKGKVEGRMKSRGRQRVGEDGGSG